MLDEGDIAFRAARGNFGLVWVQGKGTDFPPYAQWTWTSAQSWPELNAELQGISGEDIGYRRPGGVEICLDAGEFERTEEAMRRLQSHAHHFEFQMLDRRALSELLPGLGPDVAGGCYSLADGHVNPLGLLRSLHHCFKAKGGQIDNGSRVIAIRRRETSFDVDTTTGHYQGARVILAAGLGTEALAAMIGMKIPLRPERGQILVTERLRPFLSMPVSMVRQTTEGSVQLGASKENVGFDEGTLTTVMNRIAKRAVRVFPHLARARIVRAWGALRVMTPDTYPIYAQSRQHPGAFAAVCHSGVTLAAAHALHLAAAIDEGILPENVTPMNAGRFDHA
jgi:glycine/D-amino acid oxidase-like deaminating enzyme